MNKVIDVDGKELDSNFQITTIDHQLGLVLESRGGEKRNPDYNEALETILERLKSSNAQSIRVKIASEDLRKHFHNPLDRTILVDGFMNIPLQQQDIVSLRRKIGSAVSKIKVKQSSKGGNPTKRIQLISSGLGQEEWKSIAFGKKLLNDSIYGEFFSIEEFEQKVDELLKSPINTRPIGNRKPRRIERASSEIIERDPSVKAWILQNSEGKCEYCEKDSPFIKANGNPYLEIHHLRQLANQGSDTIENAVALCPNCHKEFHFGSNKQKLLKEIYHKIPRLIKE